MPAATPNGTSGSGSSSSSGEADPGFEAVHCTEHHPPNVGLIPRQPSAASRSSPIPGPAGVGESSADHSPI